MGEEITKMYHEANTLKTLMLRDKAIEVLLFLAKYNPKTTEAEIKKCFGGEVIETLEDFKKYDLVRSEADCISLTEEGIFQVDWLVSLTEK